jgi:hypothetical protein
MHQIHEVFLRYLCWGRHVLEGMPCGLGLGTRATTIGAALTPWHALGYMLPLAFHVMKKTACDDANIFIS